MVEWLLSSDFLEPYREELLNARATGDFFKMYGLSIFVFVFCIKIYFFLSRGKPSYYGEYPLGFACCTNQWDIVEILLRYGANMEIVS